MRIRALSAVAAAAVVMSACQAIDLAPTRSVLDASMALGLAGSIAMTAIAQEGPDCVEMFPACTGAPCAARVEVQVSEACPLALGEGSSGDIILDGEWTDADTATFVPDLGSVDVGIEDGRVDLGLGVVVVTRDEDEVTVVFGEQGVSAGNGEEGSNAGVDQEGWVVRVQLGGTPSDPADDALEISGGGQLAGAASGDGQQAGVRQLAVAKTVTDPSCRLNPMEGIATLNRVGDEALAQTVLSFHEGCDGQADVLASTGDPFAIGSEVDLGYAAE
jgi:hypothetical protein